MEAIMERRWTFIKPYFLYFLMYAVFGWMYEVFLEVVVYRWGFSDRGVLFGPWCPVYGVGAMAFLLCFRRFVARPRPGWPRLLKPLLIFLGCALVATAIELATSYMLEALIGSWPWQTYADYAINFQGRIALSPSLRFGLGGLIFLYLFQPAFEWLIGKLPPQAFNMVFGVALALFLTDCAATLICKFVF